MFSKEFLPLTAYFFTVLLGVFVLLPLFLWLEKKEKAKKINPYFRTIEQTAIDVLSLLLPFVNLLVIGSICYGIYKKYTFLMFVKNNPQTETLNKLKIIQKKTDKFLTYEYRTANNLSFLDIQKSLCNNLEKKLNDDLYSALLIRYDFSLNEIISAIDEMTPFGNEEVLKLILSSQDIFIKMFDEMTLIIAKEEEGKALLCNIISEKYKQRLDVERELQNNYQFEHKL